MALGQFSEWKPKTTKAKFESIVDSMSRAANGGQLSAEELKKLDLLVGGLIQDCHELFNAAMFLDSVAEQAMGALGALNSDHTQLEDVLRWYQSFTQLIQREEL